MTAEEKAYYGNCEVCGQQAKHWVQDVVNRPSRTVGMKQSEPLGSPHRFCDLHRRKSRTVDSNY